MQHDILCLNETNSIVDKLPKRMEEITIEIENFREPHIKTSCRDTGRGGGLAIYINLRSTQAMDLAMA